MTFRKSFSCLLPLLALYGALSARNAAADEEHHMDFERDAVSLNGTWQCLWNHADAEVWRPAVAETLDGWFDFELPGRGPSTLKRDENEKIEACWLKRRFTLDAAHAARGAVLKWGGIKFGATAWINGQEMGRHDAMGPATMMVPPGVLREGENGVVLRARGWAALHKSRTGIPLIPVGGELHWGGRGVYVFDDIWLEFYDRAYVSRALALPDLQGGAVTLRVELASATALPAQVDLKAAVGLEGRRVGVAEVAVDPGAGPFNLTVPLSDVRPWTPDSPTLYDVHLTATADGKPCDDVGFHFGMREISVQDGHYRLNGKPLWLRGSNLVHEWLWGGEFQREPKRYLIDEARNMSLNCFRTHTLPPNTQWADIADENGMMVLAEFSVTWNYREAGFTPEEWEQWHHNVMEDAEGWVTRLWNHPAVIMWVLTNEPGDDHEWEAGPYHDFVRGLDPTRVTMRTGETHLATESVVDLHPTGNYNFGPDGQLMLDMARAARSKDPHRALSNSEYMNVFGPRERVVRRRLGRPDHPYAQLDFAECAAEDTEAMRRLRFDCILPYMYAGWPRFRGNNWRPDFPTPMAAALHSSMAPVLASLDLFDRNYVAGTSVTTPLHLINETLDDVNAKVALYLTPEDPQFVPVPGALAAAIDTQGFEAKLPANSIEVRNVTWRVPEKPGTYYLAAVLEREAARPVVSQRTVRAVPAPEATRARSVMTVGADDALRRLLDASGVEHVEAGQSPDVVLVWSRPGAADPSPDRLRQMAEGGARVVLSEPEGWPWEELTGLNAGEKRYPQSTVFAFDASDPVLAGVDPECLKRWNGLPGVVSFGNLFGDGLEGAQKVLWSGVNEDPVLVRIPVGKGQIVVSMLTLRDHVAAGSPTYDPVAEQVLLNLLARP